MTTNTKAKPKHAVEHDDEHHGDHPTDLYYWKVGLGLALITGAEVGTYFITDDPYSHSLRTPLIVSLLAMMTIKFVVIAGAFMHLKFDNKIFRYVFVAGLLLALAVYIAVLASMNFWWDGYEAEAGLGLF